MPSPPVAATAAACSGESPKADQDPDALTVTSNSIEGGKNSAGAEWVQNWVIPNFIAAQKEKGREVSLTFEPQGVDDDEDYKTKIALDLKSQKGADVLSIDGIWVGEFAQAQYIKPLEETTSVSGDWEGGAGSRSPRPSKGRRASRTSATGSPRAPTVALIYFNKDLFRAGRAYPPTGSPPVGTRSSARPALL